jgi:prepilin-type N-terminal cleavage/methylation domain-containing protein
MMGNTNIQRGFTIVELLIVIVIIAILAAITIVAYNGIQDRAQNTQRIAAAKDYQKIILSYMTQYGTYPKTLAITETYCLGDGYPDWDANGAEDCFASNNIKNVNAAVNTELKKVATSLPNFNKSPVADGAVQRLGIGYRGINIDGQAGRAALFYYLKGANVPCGLNNLLSLISGNDYTATSAAYTSSSATATTCVVELPNPASL